MASADQQNSTNLKETTKISAVNYVKEFTASLKRHIWLLAAFFIPLTIRSIPEIISWPYPLGLDTLRYIPAIEAGNSLSSVLAFVKSQLFYSFGTLAYWLMGDGIVVIKVFGPLLMGLVATMMYLYARRGLSWSGPKSFLVSLLVAIYFVSLRNSWDLYAQSVGLIFLLATLIMLKSFNKTSYGFMFTSVFMLLTVLSHQLVSVILFFIVAFESMRFLVTKSYRSFIFLSLSLGLSVALFIFRTYSESTASVVIPSQGGTSEPAFAMASTFVGLMIYGYGLLLPFVTVGLFYLKDWLLRFWIVWCMSAMVLLIMFPSLPLYYWPRWYYFLVYPLLFFAVEGLSKLYHLCAYNQQKVKRSLPKIFAILYVTILLILGGFYVTAAPQTQISFFSSDNPFLVYIPSSLVQNTLPICENPSLVNCFEWLNNNTDQNSAVVMHYALFDLSNIYLHGPLVIYIANPASIYVHTQNQTALVNDMIDASVSALNAGNSTVYTVWWVNGKGWYEIPSLPPAFIEVYRSGQMAVYAFGI